MIDSDEIRRIGLEYYKQGHRNFTEIARMVHKDLEITPDQRAIDQTRRQISKCVGRKLKRNAIKADNPSLVEETERIGIDPTTVRQAWHKGKHWSIQFRPTADDGPSFEQMLQDHIESIKNHTFSYEKIERELHPDAHLLVVDPADVHIGKLASSFETGEEYNSEIAIQRVRDGVNGILHKASGFPIEQIIFVAGNDILHIDTPKRTTTAGTPQDTDGMWYECFLKAKQLYVEVIERLMTVADVHFMYNPSNHDYTNGFFLADSIHSWFGDCENVTFDVSLAHRKYYTYGKNLIGTTHGDGAKWQDLGKLMSVESKDWNGDKSFKQKRYIYTHHVHHKMAKDDIGVTIESLRSPSSADSWHHRKGYQHSPKAVEGFLHHKDFGQVARFTHLF
jgi:hypothetical protein